MDENLISGKRYLFAYCITDGALNELPEEQRAAIIRAIESILKEHQPADSERKHTNNIKIKEKYHF